LSIGGCDPLDMAYIRALRDAAETTHAQLISDHVCWTGIDGVDTHELLPLPRTEATLRHVVDRVRQVQESLGRALVLENPSTYVDFGGASMPEPEFLARIAENSGCGILL